MAKSNQPARSRPTTSTRRKVSFDGKLGERIRQRRNELNLTQTEVARRLGVSRIQMHKYESGENRPSVDRLFALAQIFDVPMAWFFSPFDEERVSAGSARIPPLSDDEIVQRIEAAVRGMRNPLLKLQVLEVMRALAEADRMQSGKP